MNDLSVNTYKEVLKVLKKAKKDNNIDNADLCTGDYVYISYDSYTRGDAYISNVFNYLDICGLEMVIRPKEDLHSVEEVDGLVRVTYSVYPRHIVEFESKDLLKTLKVEFIDHLPNNRRTPAILKKTLVKSVSLYMKVFPTMDKNLLSLCRHLAYGRHPERILW